MAPPIGHWHTLVAKNAQLLKAAWKSTRHLLQARVPAYLRGTGSLVPIPVRVSRHQSLHPVAALRQSQRKWYSTHGLFTARARSYSSVKDAANPGLKYNRQLFPKSRTATTVNSLTGRAPFASTLRPNLTGGVLGRTAGGYSIGSGRVGGARYFSHTPAAPAQVVQNVSQAMRAFFVSGQKAQFAGVNPHNREKRFRAVSTAHDTVTRTVASLPKATPGSYVDFKINPTITALAHLKGLTGYTTQFDTEEQNLNTCGLIDVLSVDFSRSLKDLAAILNDLKLLAGLGDLPITYRSESGAIRVHFPGCDAGAVERLCQELGVRRGIVDQDDDFDTFAGTEIALLFPFAPTRSPSSLEDMFDAKKINGGSMYQAQPFAEPIEWQTMMSAHLAYDLNIPDDDFSIRSETEDVNPWALADPIPSPEGYESMSQDSGKHEHSNPLEYQDFEGLCKFIELCDGARAV